MPGKVTIDIYRDVCGPCHLEHGSLPQSWEGARPGAEPYREFVERWTTDAFRSYVGDLQTAVDRQLAASAGEEARESADAFLWVTHYERGFWDMAMSS